MMKLLQPVLDHWEYLSVIAVILTNIVNAMTKHFSEQKALIKWLGFITEMLSIVSSKGTQTQFRRLKPPLMSVPPAPKEKVEEIREKLEEKRSARK